MPVKKEIVKQVTAYTVSSQTAQLITLAAALLTRRFLGPLQMGIWTTLQIVVEYSKYTTLGVTTAMSREIPYLLGKQQDDKAEEIKNLVFTFSIATGFFVSLGIVLFSFLTNGIFRPEITYGLLFVSAMIFLLRLNNIYVSLLRCYKNFYLAGNQLILSAIVNALLIAWLGYAFKIYGFMAALLLSLLFNIAFVQYFTRWKFKWRFSRPEFQPLMAYGFPLMMTGILTTVFRSLDKIFIAKQMGFEMLGYYSLGVMASSFISNISTSIGIVLFPHFQNKFGERDSRNDLKNYVLKSSVGYALLMPLIIGPVWTFLPWLISVFLPHFVPGIPAMKYLSLSLYFAAVAEPFQHFLITVKKHMMFFPAMGSAIIATCLGISYAIMLGWGISGVAWIMVCAFFIYFSILFATAGSMIFAGREALKVYSKLVVPLVYLVGAITLIGRLFAASPLDFYSAAFQTLSLWIFLIPLVIFLNSKSHVFFAFFPRNLS